MAYALDGIQYPSVTSILGLVDKSSALTWWASRCAVDYIRENIDRIQNPRGAHEIDGILNDAVGAFRDASRKAVDIGSQVHHAIEDYIKRGVDPTGELSPEVQNGFLAFLEWEHKTGVEWGTSELTLFSTAHGYAGTTDIIADINGHRFLIDFKTSKAVYDEYRMQAGAYRQAYNEMYQEPIHNVGILRLDKETGAPDFTDVTTGLERWTTAFNELIHVYYALKKRRLKNNPFVKEYWK